MIEPEVDKSLLQLSFARDGADELLIDELRMERPFASNLLGKTARSAGLGLVACARRLHAQTTARVLSRQVEFPNDGARVEASRAQLPKMLLDRRIGDPMGVQLLLEVGVHADGPDALEIAWSRAKCGSIEHVHDVREVIGWRGGGMCDSCGYRVTGVLAPWLDRERAVGFMQYP